MSLERIYRKRIPKNKILTTELAIFFVFSDFLDTNRNDVPT
ncbi:hypothetical protein BMS3Bbin09_00108 [bacterium BMS3Bbin09]|nr:hypothetical protein BMS3Bbin09_00108 [bacterium BMS3Bbin09]